MVIAGLLQSILPPPPPTVVGMDIGTTYSCVAIFNSGVGNVLVIPDQEGRKVIPSVVAFTQDGTLFRFCLIFEIVALSSLAYATLSQVYWLGMKQKRNRNLIPPIQFSMRRDSSALSMQNYNNS